MKTEAEVMTGNSPFAERVRHDCQLADALPVVPPTGAPAPRVILLTGATGFLGRYAVRELLHSTELRLVCPVRGATLSGARARLTAILQSIGVDEALSAERIEVLCGDVTEPMLGFTAADYERLSTVVDRVYHIGALVNWARSYQQLRAANVLGTLEVLRFALSMRAKPLVYVSSISVCFAHDGPELVDEHTPLVPHVQDMPLGYAQSKCVAESLVRSVAARGLPAVILRPSLIGGDSRTGQCNPDDLIAALVEGCAASQTAIDTDWLVDCVPVDFVASVLARVPLPEVGCEVLHLVHDKPRHWREFVLWLNLNGHAMRFVTDDEWFELLDAPAIGSTRLRGYRRFFQGLPGAGTRRPFEAYLRSRQERLSSLRSHGRLEELGLRIPPLDGELFRRYLDCYVSLSLLPATDRRALSAADASSTPATAALIAAACSSTGSPAGRVSDVALHPFDSMNGILNEIAGARLGAAVGLRHATFTLVGERSPPSRHDVILKSKARDELTIELISELAALRDREVGAAFARTPEALGLPGCQERELMIYELREPRLERFLPSCYGTHRDAAARVWTLVLERLCGVEQPWTDARSGMWTHATINAVIRDLAAIHAIWYRDSSGLAAHACLRSNREPEQLLRRRPLWDALHRYALPSLRGWAGAGLELRYAELLTVPERWTKALCAQRPTLIHNDFNPRNLILRDGPYGPQLCVFDWELATLGSPQRDLAEFLCFVTTPQHGPQNFAHWLETHRRLLSHASGVPVERWSWLSGFAGALDHFLAERLSMYVLFDRFRPLPYLPQVVRNWLCLREWADQLALAPERPHGAERSAGSLD